MLLQQKKPYDALCDYSYFTSKSWLRVDLKTVCFSSFSVSFSCLPTIFVQLTPRQPSTGHPAGWPCKVDGHTLAAETTRPADAMDVEPARRLEIHGNCCVGGWEDFGNVGNDRQTMRKPGEVLIIQKAPIHVMKTISTREPYNINDRNIQHQR